LLSKSTVPEQQYEIRDGIKGEKLAFKNANRLVRVRRSLIAKEQSCSQSKQKLNSPESTASGAANVVSAE
jgi:hypothetical protein